MNNVSSLLKPAMMALSLAVVPVFATAAEERPPLLEVGKPRESTEVTTTMVLHQRLDERTLDTERGLREIPFSVELVDTRPVDQWYEAQDALVTFHFSNDLELKRVVISK